MSVPGGVREVDYLRLRCLLSLSIAFSLYNHVSIYLSTDICIYTHRITWRERVRQSIAGGVRAVDDLRLWWLSSFSSSLYRPINIYTRISMFTYSIIYSDGAYTKGTRAHTHRELIREWLWEPKGSSLEYI